MASATSYGNRNPIVSGYPDFIVSGDERKPCETHFRVWLQISRCLDDPTVPESEKLWSVIALSGIEPGDPQSDLQGIAEFLAAGADTRHRRRQTQRVMDYDVDAGLIVASFQSEYGIDITARGCDLHWWRFCDLLRGMGDSAPIMRAVQIRTEELPTGNDEWSRKRREVIGEAKRRLAIPSKTAAEKAAKDRMLWGE